MAWTSTKNKPRPLWQRIYYPPLIGWVVGVVISICATDALSQPLWFLGEVIVFSVLAGVAFVLRSMW